ncbi:class II fructose-bisphosphate aldolase, partial [Salmonella enterica subsp. enterica serovar Virginia]|nr:class II fructose-bisphosphate aldolase [Salmonella enterica subsp. enterica serovar Virginia]
MHRADERFNNFELKHVQKVFQVAKENNFALPAVNCVGTDSINAVLETAAKVKAPVIV